MVEEVVDAVGALVFLLEGVGVMKFRGFGIFMLSHGDFVITELMILARMGDGVGTSNIVV